MKNFEFLSFDKLPDAVLKLIDEVIEMKRLLRKEHEDETIKICHFNSDNIVPFFEGFGIRMSKSRLYKLTSKNEIPFIKMGNQLLFERDELLKWINNQTNNPSATKNASINSLSNSARNKSNPKGSKNE